MSADPPKPPPGAAPAGGLLRWTLLESAVGPFLALGAVFLLFGMADLAQADGGGFFTWRNARAISVQTATVAVAALGMTLIIIAGGIDLSAGTALALSATVLAWSLKEDVALLAVEGDNIAGATAKRDEALQQVQRLDERLDRLRQSPAGGGSQRDELLSERNQLAADAAKKEERFAAVKAASPRLTPWTPSLAVMLAVGTGCLCGLFNGMLIGWLRVVPFIVTLGTMTFYLGVAKMVAGETTVRPDRATQVPDWLTDFLSIRPKALWGGSVHVEDFLGIKTLSLELLFPAGVWLALLLAVALAAVLRYTVFGRYVFALGSNEATARLCGINVTRNKIAIYALAGLFIGIAGLYQFSRLSTGNPTSGIGMELKIIAAVVIGGGSLSGGRGSVLGSLTGAAIMAVIASGCTQLGLNNPVQDIILGVIIIAAVAIDQLRQRRLAS